MNDNTIKVEANDMLLLLPANSDFLQQMENWQINANQLTIVSLTENGEPSFKDIISNIQVKSFDKVYWDGNEVKEIAAELEKGMEEISEADWF